MGVELWSDRRGREPVREYTRAIGAAGERSQVAAFERRLELLADRGPEIGMPLARLINRQERVYELRFGDHRCAYVEAGQAIVLLHAWRKQTQNLDAREERRALGRLSQL